MFNQVGPLELILVLVIVLVIFGPKRLPSLGRQLGRGMREFKDSITSDRGEAEEQQSLPAPTAEQPAPPVAPPVAPPHDTDPAAAQHAEPRS